MHVGIDIQSLRMEKRGIYHYIWHILEQMDRQEVHRLVLYLYGQPWMDEPCELKRWAEAFPHSEREYYWNVPPLRLLSHRLGQSPAEAPRLVRWVDRRLLGPLWQRLAAPTPGPRLWHRQPRPLGVDVFHHTAGLLFPLEGHANVITIYDLIPFRKPGYNLAATVMFGDGFAHAARMDRIITISEFTKRDIVQSLGVDEHKVRSIPLAVDEQFRYLDDRDEVRQAQVKHGIDRRPYVVHLGSIEARKNLHRLLEAFNRLKRAPDAPPHELILVGADGGNFDEIKAKIADMGVDARCLGYVPRADLPAVLNGADLFMYPSLYEGFGLPGIEAMACGTPVAAANATSLPEVIGNAGLLFDPLDVEEMTAVMRRVLTEPGLRNAMRTRGRSRAAEFSWERTARETMAVYEEAWDSFQRNSRHPGGKALQTRFRQELRKMTVAQVAAYTQKGTRIQYWL